MQTDLSRNRILSEFLYVRDYMSVKKLKLFLIDSFMLNYSRYVENVAFLGTQWMFERL